MRVPWKFRAAEISIHTNLLIASHTSLRQTNRQTQKTELNLNESCCDLLLIQKLRKDKNPTIGHVMLFLFFSSAVYPQWSPIYWPPPPFPRISMLTTQPANHTTFEKRSSTTLKFGEGRGRRHPKPKSRTLLCVGEPNAQLW